MENEDRTVTSLEMHFCDQFLKFFSQAGPIFSNGKIANVMWFAHSSVIFPESGFSTKLESGKNPGGSQASCLH